MNCCKNVKIELPNGRNFDIVFCTEDIKIKFNNVTDELIVKEIKLRLKDENNLSDEELNNTKIIIK